MAPLHVPQRPEEPPQPVPAPMVYVSQPVTWEYKQLARELAEEGLLDEASLNEWGTKGWELAAVVTHAGKATYLFKRRAD